MNLIVVEGKSDKFFLEQYIHYKNQNFVHKIIENNSNKLMDSTLQQIQKALDNDNKVYIIFDADLNYTTTRKTLENQIKNIPLQQQDNIKIFLFPDNQKSGELETLLFDIVPEEYQGIVKCFDKYLECIKSKFPHLIKNINKKSKMYAYRELNGFTVNNYELYFNFDSLSLQPLYEFLFSESK